LQYLGQQIETDWSNFLKKSNANIAVHFLQAKFPDDFNCKLFKKMYLSFINIFHEKKQKKKQENEEKDQNEFEEDEREKEFEEEESNEFEQKIEKDLEQVK
jgi:hypothetical protein